MSIGRLLLPTALIATGLACNNLKPAKLDQFRVDSGIGSPEDSDGVDEGDDTDAVEGTDGNRRPFASAGPGVEASVGDTIALDGSGSSDLDGDRLSFAWQVNFKPTGSRAEVENESFATAQIEVDKAGDYEIQLTVDDGELSDVDVVRIIVDAPNSPPIADAGLNQSTATGSLVQLTGAASSDPDGDSLTYQWTLQTKPGGSIANLVGISVQPAVTPRFTADLPGQYVVELIVDDGIASSSPDLVYVTATDAGGGSTGGGGGSEDCLSCAEAEQVGRRWSMGDAAYGIGMALLPFAVFLRQRRRDIGGC